jgi:hypothetical protein
MSPLRIVAIALIVGGVLGLVYGSFTYISGTHDVDLGVVELSTTDRETVNVPVWAGVGAIVAGTALLVIRKPA